LGGAYSKESLVDVTALCIHKAIRLFLHLGITVAQQLVIRIAMAFSPLLGSVSVLTTIGVGVIIIVLSLFSLDIVKCC